MTEMWFKKKEENFMSINAWLNDDGGGLLVF